MKGTDGRMKVVEMKWEIQLETQVKACPLRWGWKMEVYRDFQEDDEVMILSLGYIGKYLLCKTKSQNL